jgi:poly(3-hydroxybutyrate) depolymerase
MLVPGVLVALLASVLVAPVASAAPAGLELRSTRTLSPRLTELRVYSPALAHEANVRVLTPDGFDPDRDHLPVLWLLHGGFGSSADWTTAGDAEALTADLPMIVVMPDAGTGGWYTDWLRGTPEGPQRWETFHLDELRPFIEARYRTRTDRGGRAIAGLSMGGFGAMSYAARHPDLFGFAASFSGAVDLLHPGISAVVTISPLAHQGAPRRRLRAAAARRASMAGAQPSRPRGEPARSRDPAPHRQRPTGRPAWRQLRPRGGGRVAGDGDAASAPRRTRHPAPVRRLWAGRPYLAVLARRPRRDASGCRYVLRPSSGASDRRVDATPRCGMGRTYSRGRRETRS